MKIISVVSTKGGVGKSSTTIMVANYLAAMGKSVLVVDTDYNNSTTLYFVDSRAALQGKGFGRAMQTNTLNTNVISTRNPQIDIIPSNTDIEQLNIRDQLKLKTLIAYEAPIMSTYDVIIIDTSQGYNSIVENAIYASDLILTPVLCSQFDLIASTTLQTKIIEANKLQNWLLFFNATSHYVYNRNSSQYQYISIYKNSIDRCTDIYLPKTSRVTNAIDRDMKISKKTHLRLYEGIKALVGIILGKEADEVEAF